MKIIRKNNKGAAMITVLIAVSFIVILASSLIYMSYMNFITKSMRYSSTDNFYTDELALDNLCISLQQVAADNNSSVTAAIAAIKTQVGATPCGTQYRYDGEAMKTNGLVRVALEEADITIDTTYTDPNVPNMEVTTTSVKLLGVMVTSLTPSGYKSTISTDIEITFPNGGLGDLDVNDFSVITDSPITVQSGDVFFGGCVYMDKGSSGDTALTIQDGGNVHILSSRGIINGNIKVESGGFLAITGRVSVIGEIHLYGDAVLVCSDQLKCTGGITTHGTAANVIPSNTNRDSTLDPSKITIPSNGLTQDLFAEVFLRGSGNSSEFTSVSLEDFASTWRSIEQTKNGLHAMVGFGTQQQTNEGDYKDGLIMSPGDVRVRGDMPNSTIVCSGTLIFDIGTAPTYMQRLNDDAFEMAKLILLKANGGPIDGVDNPNFMDGLWVDNILTEPNAVVKEDDYGRPNVWFSNSKANAVPAGNFLVPNSSEVITNLFKDIQGDSDPVDSSIVITNWTKL